LLWILLWDLEKKNKEFEKNSERNPFC